MGSTFTPDCRAGVWGWSSLFSLVLTEQATCLSVLFRYLSKTFVYRKKTWEIFPNTTLYAFLASQSHFALFLFFFGFCHVLFSALTVKVLFCQWAIALLWSILNFCLSVVSVGQRLCNIKHVYFSKFVCWPRCCVKLFDFMSFHIGIYIEFNCRKFTGYLYD